MPGYAAFAQTVGPFQPVADQAMCRGNAGYSDAFEGRRTFLWRPEWLHALAADDKNVERLSDAADQAIGNGPYSVTDKPKPIPSAQPNDYVSIGPYWWPDPNKRGGLPYYRRDGEVNPQRNGPEFDKARLNAFSNDARDLALGYFVTGDERYANKAAELLRIWFINPKTRMNPNMNFAQGILGKVNGRGEGIIEAAHLSTIVEAIGLLRPSQALSAAEHQAIEGWYRDFAVWMATSDNGADEMNKNNNHGMFYDFYLGHFALYAGLDGVARKLADSFPSDRLARQMDKQGRFLAELKRTRSWHYSHYVVEAAVKLATIAECVDKDLWTHTQPDGRGLASAQAFLAKYWAGDVSWPFNDVRLENSGKPLGTSTSIARVRLMFLRADITSASPDILPWNGLP